MGHLQETIRHWKRICSDPATPLALLKTATYWEAISTPRKHCIRLCVARHGHADQHLLSALSQAEYLPLLIAVAAHPNLSERTACALVKKQFRYLRKSLASNPYLPAQIMDRLARDSFEVREALAANPNLSGRAMDILTRQRDPRLHLVLARHPRLSGQAFDRLLQDPRPSIRFLLVSNPSALPGHLHQLATDDEQSIQRGVLMRGLRDFPGEEKLFTSLLRSSLNDVASRARAQLRLIEQNAIEEQRPVENPLARTKLTLRSRQDVLADIAASHRRESESVVAVPVLRNRSNEKTQLIWLGTHEQEEPGDLRPLIQQLHNSLAPLDGVSSLDFIRVINPYNPSSYRFYVVFRCRPEARGNVLELARTHISQVC